MAEVEKYIPRRIVRDISPEAVKPGGDRELLPGTCTDAMNCRIYSSDGDGNQFLVENVRGNSLINFALPSGNNTCIGTFIYKKLNSIVYHIHNDQGNHRVIEWNFDTQAFTVLLAGAFLNYSLDHYVSQGGIIDDIHLFNDAYNGPRKINIARAKAGFYSGATKQSQISLVAQPSMVPPTVALATDPTFSLNLISNDTWQFAYRFVYIDGENSVFSPLSKLAYAGLNFNPANLTNNVVNVTITIPPELLPYLRTVEVAYRAGNIGNYFIFEQIQNPNQTTYVVIFRNNALSLPVAAEDAIMLYDNIPPVTDALGIIKNRSFIVLNDSGFDVSPTFSLSIAVQSEAQVAGKRYFKNAGTFNVGIVCYDDNGQCTFVKSKQQVAIPFDGNFNYLQWTLSGTPPAGVTRYQIVVSQNLAHQVYSQVPAIVFYYASEAPPNTTEGTIYDTYFIWRGHKFIKLENGVNPDPSRGDSPFNYLYVYLQIPTNTPIQVDNTYYIRILDASLHGRIIPIVGIVDDFIVINPIKNDDGTAYQWAASTKIELFSVNTNPAQSFYEIGEVFNIVTGSFSTNTGKIYGDTYRISASQYSQYPFIFTPLVLSPNTYVPPQGRAQAGGAIDIESPTGILSNSLLEVDIRQRALSSSGQTFGARPSGTTNSGTGTIYATVGIDKNVFSFDYNKIASDYGRVHTENNNEKKNDENTSVAYSDPFFQDTLVFGLNTFRPENIYSIPRDRSPIRGFKKANRILLAIHERATSSMYIGEGLIAQNNDFVLAKTDNVIGDDRELEFNYGCINPESILEVYGHVYWWDAYRGAVVRYTNAGLFAVSDYGLATYFYYKGRAYEPYRNQVKIITGYDYLNEEFLITFPAVANTNIQAETWAFNPKENAWMTRYSYIPEQIISLNNNLYTFKNGQLWIHHENDLFNNFYGQQYQRYFDLIFNPRLGKSKRLLNIHLKGKITTDLTSENQVVIITNKEGQQSYIPAYEFYLDEGKYMAPVLRDINTPNIESGRLALRSGDSMVSNSFIVRVVNDRTDNGECSQINVIFKTEEFSV